MLALGQGAPQQAQPQQGDSPKTSGIEVTPDNPAQGSADKRAQAIQLTDQDKQDLLQLVRHYKELWALPRRVTIRNTLRRYEYVKGNQYISFDPYNFQFFDPFDSGVSGSQQSKDDAGSIYSSVTNVVQWLLRVFVSTLGGTLPATRFSPSDAENDSDNRTAEKASRANALVERWNNARRMLKQRLAYLGLAGVYFRHTRWVRDSRLCGTKKQPIEQMQSQEVYPDSYICPGCGNLTPAKSVASLGGALNCQNCGHALGSEDFYPAVHLDVPVVTGYEDVAQGQVRQTVYSNLQVQIAPWDDESGQDPLTNTPLLDLAVEIDQAALRLMYPDDWESVEGSGEGGSSPEGELDRMARLRSYIPGLTRGSSLMSTGQLPTYSRCWIQPIAYAGQGDKEKAARFKQLFPDGCCVASVNGKFLDVRPASLTDEWTMCTTGITPGPNPPAVLDPAMDFQDRINDRANAVDEYFDRLSCGPVLYNTKMVTGKGLNGRYLPPGTMLGIAVNTEMGKKMEDAFWQPKFSIDGGWKSYLDMLMLQAQLLTGVTPQMYGGHQQGIDTKGGQEQALNVATGIMRLYWDQVREEDSEAAKLAVKCMADNATEDLLNVIEGDTGPGSFKNEKFALDDLKGEFSAYPDEEQGYPISFEETRDMLQQIVEQGAKNPLVQEMFEPMSNRRYFARYLAPGLEIPGQKQRRKVIDDIAQLLQGTPMPQRDPITKMEITVPSVIPDRDFDDMDVAQETVREFAENNYYLAKQRPKQFMNLRLYYKLAVRFQRELQQESAPPAPPALPAAGPGAGP